MKRLLLSSVALVGMLTAAAAADLPRQAMPVKAAPMVPMTTTWTGFYVGGHIGGAFRDNNNLIGGLNTGNDGRFIAGGQIGADYQFWNTWVVGFEANYSWVDRTNDSTVFAGGFALNDQTRGLFSATGRLGYAWGPVLLYGKGGYAYRDAHQTFTGPGGVVAVTNNGASRDGYTLGGGLEYMFMPSWSAKLEYQYYQFGRTQFVTPAVLAGAGPFRDEEHTIKLGLNYRFNMGGQYMR